MALTQQQQDAYRNSRPAYIQAVKEDLFARKNGNWPRAEQHQADARAISDRLHKLFGYQIEEDLTMWRNEGIREAHRILDLIDSGLALIESHKENLR